MPITPGKPPKKMTKAELLDWCARLQDHERGLESSLDSRNTQLTQRGKRIEGLEGEVHVLDAQVNDVTAVAQDAMAHGAQVFHWEPGDFNGRVHDKEIRRQQEALQDAHERAQKRRQRNHERASLPEAAMTKSDEAPHDEMLPGVHVHVGAP